MGNDIRNKTENNKKMGGNDAAKNKKSGLKKRLINLVCVPLFLMGILTMIFAYIMGYSTVSNEVKQGLNNIAQATLYAYSDIYDNEIAFTDKGNGTYGIDTSKSPYIPSDSFLRYLSEKSGTEITLMYYDIRLMTTLKGADGSDLAGTVVSKKVVDEVMAGSEPVFYDDLVIGDKNFCVCYLPVIGQDGTLKGIVSAGKPVDAVKSEIIRSIWPMILIALFMMVIGAAIGSGEAKKLADVIDKEKNFLGQIADGNLRANLDAEILKRPDELGEMGKFTVHVQKFIRDMIERDTLTKLYTRRIGETRMRNTRMGLIEDGVKYVMAMGDIDHFKKFNDTYGHDCGDLVLQTVAGVFNRMMMGRGYAVRWGGEEFIIVFEDSTFEKAYDYLKEIREAIINEVVEYKGEYLGIRMSFGIMPGSTEELDDIIKKTDELLYIAKEGGRDRIVKYDDYEEIERVKALMEEKDAGKPVEKAAEREVSKPLEQAGSSVTESEEDRLEAMMKNML